MLYRKYVPKIPASAEREYVRLTDFSYDQEPCFIQDIWISAAEEDEKACTSESSAEGRKYELDIKFEKR